MLWEFVQKRLKELGMMVAQLTDDFDIMPTTVQRIRDGRVIKESTKQKLALALKCSVGEINDAIAGRQNQENAEEPSVMEAADKPEQMARASEEEPAGPEKPKREKLVHPYTEMQRAEEARRKESQPKERWPKDDIDAKLYSMAARWKLENETKPGQKDEVMYSERELDEICKKRSMNTNNS